MKNNQAVALINAIKKNDINNIYNEWIENDYSFKAFVEENKNKTIKEICENYNIDSRIASILIL